LKDLSSSFDILKKKFKGYEDRPEQREMAGEILDFLVEKNNLLIEAGTGVGKSFAYLIPAILSREKTICVHILSGPSGSAGKEGPLSFFERRCRRSSHSVYSRERTTMCA